VKAFLPPADPLAALLLRLRRTHISSEKMAAAIREEFDVTERRKERTSCR
jgi:hypothetical protein